MIAGRKSIYRCQAIESGTVLELQASDLRTLIAKDAELSDIFMNAFLARRLSLKTGGHGNVVVLGSRYSADTLAVREFLSATDILSPTSISIQTRRRRNCLIASESVSRTFPW